MTPLPCCVQCGSGALMARRRETGACTSVSASVVLAGGPPGKVRKDMVSLWFR